MLRIGPRPRLGDALVPGGAFVSLGVVAVASILCWIAFVWFAILGLPPASAPHVLVNGVATSVLLLLMLSWLALRLLGWVTADTGVGFGLAGYAVAARSLCELLVWQGEPWVRNMTGHEVPSPFLADLVRTVGAGAYVFGLAVVAVSCWQEAKATRAGALRWTVAALILLAVGLGAYRVVLSASDALPR